MCLSLKQEHGGLEWGKGRSWHSVEHQREIVVNRGTGGTGGGGGLWNSFSYILLRCGVPVAPLSSVEDTQFQIEERGETCRTKA